MNTTTPEFRKIGVEVLCLLFILSLIPFTIIWGIYALVSAILFIPTLGWSWYPFRSLTKNSEDWINMVVKRLDYIGYHSKIQSGVSNPIINNPDSYAKVFEKRFYWATVKCRRCGALVNIYAYKNASNIPPQGKCPLCGIATKDEVTKPVTKLPAPNNNSLYTKLSIK